MALEPCFMVLRGESGNTLAICIWHVDEFSFAGLPGDKMWQQEFDALRQLND